MLTKSSKLDLNQLSEDKQTQQQFSAGLEQKSTEQSPITKEFSASGGKPPKQETD